jgi:hypothetical protein
VIVGAAAGEGGHGSIKAQAGADGKSFYRLGLERSRVTAARGRTPMIGGLRSPVVRSILAGAMVFDQHAAAWAIPRGPGYGRSNTCGPIAGDAARSIKFRKLSNIDQRLRNPDAHAARITAPPSAIIGDRECCAPA